MELTRDQAELDQVQLAGAAGRAARARETPGRARPVPWWARCVIGVVAVGALLVPRKGGA